MFISFQAQSDTETGIEIPANVLKGDATKEGIIAINPDEMSMMKDELSMEVVRSKLVEMSAPPSDVSVSLWTFFDMCDHGYVISDAI